jgi:uncharacterized protein YkwD
VIRTELQCLGLGLLLFAVGSVSAPVPATARSVEVRERVLYLVNLARARGRICGRERFPASNPLALSQPLLSAAAAHARDMARYGYFEHRARNGSEPKDRVRRAGYRPKLTGENIAFGPETAEEVVAGWLASPGHCANLMDPRFRDMGVAVAKARQPGHYYWVQDLAAPAR